MTTPTIPQVPLIPSAATPFLQKNGVVTPSWYIYLHSLGVAINALIAASTST